MREIRFDTPTRRAYLNGKPYFLRGSNITLHRFFEDPKAGALVWDEAWVRKLLIDIPKKLHWNSFRFCIGPVPQKWLDIADEAGLLIQYEYFIWTGRNEWHPEWTEEQLIREYTEWMRDNWNHPSVALWDSNNETIAEILGDRIIPAVRGLDLSNRAWENGYNVPSGPDDPYEDHPYLFSGAQSRDKPGFRIADLENVNHARSPNSAHPTGHAAIVNEYGWLWLNRDGSPTLLTENVYHNLLGPNATNEQRLKLWAYLLGGLTELWRATRDYAGVLHFVYLTCSFPGVFTSDHWRDLEKLELDPDFADYAGEAFKPLGVYLNFWQPEVGAGRERRFPVSVINDESELASGTLMVRVVGPDGRERAIAERKFEVPGAGQQTYVFMLKMPDEPGDYTIRAEAKTAGGTTLSRRNTRVVR
jgi:beta-galactosidase